MKREVLKEIDSSFDVEVKLWRRDMKKKALQGRLQKEIVLGSDELIFFRR